MVNTPTDNYVNWARRSYPDEKTKLFPIPADRLCLFIKYAMLPIDHTHSLITYLSTHPKHGNEWCVRMRGHPAIIELLNNQRKKGNKLGESNHEIKSKCVVVETEKAKGYMFVSDKNQDDSIQQIPKAPKEFIKPTSPSVISKTIPSGKEKRKKLLKGLAEKDKTETEKRKLREEIQKKDKEIDRLNALLGQYKYLLIDEPEQECFIYI